MNTNLILSFGYLLRSTHKGAGLSFKYPQKPNKNLNLNLFNKMELTFIIFVSHQIYRNLY